MTRREHKCVFSELKIWEYYSTSNLFASSPDAVLKLWEFYFTSNLFASSPEAL